MKRLLLIIFSIFTLATIQAQTKSYLHSGDIVSIYYIANGIRYYLEASGNGALTQKQDITDDCLWRLGVTQNGNAFNYTFQDLTTGRFLACAFTDMNGSDIRLNTSPTAFSFSDAGSVEESYMYGNIYFYQQVNQYWGSNVYLDAEWINNAPYFTFHSWTQYKLYVEKWELKGAGKPTGHFNPSKIEFTYAQDDNKAKEQAREVSVIIEATTESYYQCVPRPNEEPYLRRSTDDVDANQIRVTKIYWQSDSVSKSSSVSKLDKNNYVTCPETDGRDVLSKSDYTYNEQDKKWQFTVTPVGASPMGLKDKLGTLERWIDYADNVIVEYTYGGGTTQKAEMRVVRKSYHEEVLPTISFSINPVTYTFSKEGTETKQFDVTLTHQHGSVIYNVDNQVIKTNCTYGPVHVKLNEFHKHFTGEDAWEKTYRFRGKGTPWLDLDDGKFQDKGDIYIQAYSNESGLKRSDTIVFTLEKIAGESAHLHKDSFMIPLHQRGMEGGIKFKVNKGQSGDALDSDGRQQVHTAERTIYYLRNQEIELRLPESGFSGYMRWYDYETGSDPYYNYAHDKDSTHWVRSPRAANGNPFSAINTPASSNTINTEGYSYGLYAINKANGGILDESNPYNPMPIIKGWDSGAAHTMACDVSAYTDYTIWTHPTNRTRIDSIQEPTLSYRQLFHLRPASEMADKFADLGKNEYLEEYKYQAPAGKQILLSTEYRHSKVRSHESELCYFYRDKSGNLQRIDNRNNANILKWYVSDADGSNKTEFTPQYSAEMDYLIVRSEDYTYDAPKVYTLEMPAEAANNEQTLRIARFEVEFVDIERQGPTNKTIITQQRINSQYKNLAEINFNETTGHLPWEQASYGYVYTTGELATNFKRGASQGAFPFYGEYTILESVNKDWARASAHGGTGKSLYVDGTMEPGLVASITAHAKICSGQTMYCSAWFCNPAPSGWSGEGNPIFRCNIQGKNAGETEWHDAGVYFVGELLKGSGWQQIVFPIQTASSYDQTRVSIYNFATTNQGNDFMVDDITLFVSQLPIAAYQGEMACRTVEGGETTAAAVLRLDYNNITAGSDGYMFYQIYNESYDEDGDGKADGAPVNLAGEAAYYHDYDSEHGDHDHPYGSVHIPEKGFDPEVHNSTASKENKVLIYTSVSAFLDDLVLNNQKNGKAYIRTIQSGATKWLLYVVHLVQSTTQEEINKEQDEEKRKLIPLQQLFDQHKYVMRMAYTPEELPTAECNLTTPLYATQETVFRLRNSDKATISHTEIGEANNGGEEMYIHTKSTNNCPNDLYFLTSTVINHLAVDGAGGQTINIPAPIFSDWLIGDPQGDVLSEKAPTKGSMSDEEYKEKLDDYNARLQAAITGFKDMYGYTHDEVTSAIMYDMRRHTTDDPNSRDYNPNYKAKTFEELQPNRFLSHENYEIVKHLYENGWLQLCDTTVHFYLGTRLDKKGNTIGDTVRYWCFPIAETARAIVNIEGKETEITIKDCNEPHRVTVSATESDHYINIAPIAYANKTAQQSVQLPTLKVLKGSTTITIPITEISDQIKTDDADLTNISLADLTYFDLESGKPYQEKPTLEVGNEYTIRLTMKNASTSEESDPSATCRYGYVFLKLQIVPQTLVWSPSGTSFNGWGKDENWKGWKDTNSNNQIDEGELVEGFVPMAGSNVIIPNLNNPLLYPYIVPDEEDHNHSHYPMTIGFEPHNCDNIYFESGARIHNQHLLQYNKAFVDMQVTAGAWNMVSAPIQGMVSGDMFIPHNVWWSSAENNLIAESNPFEVSSFQGIRSGDAAYAFWQAFYNTTVNKMTNNGLVDVTAGAEFVQSNTLIQELNPGAGYQLYGLGWKDKEPLTIRLPKPDTEYYYYNGKGDVYGNPVQIPTANRNKLAFTPTNNATDAMDITLTNKTASQYFLFGNPTMAYINMHDFLHDNEGEENNKILNHVFYRIENGTWDATTKHTMGNDRFLAPMTSVMLEASTACTELQLTLKASHLTLNNQVSPFSEDNPAVQQAPRRAPSADEPAPTSELLTIYALTKNATARTVLATNPVANDYYLSGEDALFISTGVENESYVTTPLNMYTVAERVPMMADVRQGISNIPLAILAADKARQEYMQLAFYYTSNWSRTCYFCDSKTGQKIRIMDGLVISVEMPQNHEQRYFIEGPDTYLGSGNTNGNGTSTSVHNTNGTSASIHAYSQDKGQLTVTANQPIRELKVYSITGQLLSHPISTHNCQLSTVNCQQLPTGVCIVEATLHNGTTLHTQAIVQ